MSISKSKRVLVRESYRCITRMRCSRDIWLQLVVLCLKTFFFLRLNIAVAVEDREVNWVRYLASLALPNHLKAWIVVKDQPPRFWFCTTQWARGELCRAPSPPPCICCKWGTSTCAPQNAHGSAQWSVDIREAKRLARFEANRSVL